MDKGPEPVVQVSVSTDTTSAEEQPKKKWQSYLWDTFDKSPEERHFLFKLDAGLLSICCLGYFIKFLDQSNLTNAFVSGMWVLSATKEELGMYHNELNYVQTLWTVGYIIGQIPSNILLTRIRPSIWLPCSEIVWSVLTMCLSRVRNVHQLYALRFLIGLAESTYYPGVLYMMGSWYRKDELGKRAVIFNVVSALATMFSGFLMTAVIHLHGRGGLQGWQWLYIMDGVISLPIALVAFFVIPDSPENSRVWYINEKDREIAKRRMRQEKRQLPQPYTKAKVWSILTSWHMYLLPPLFFFGGAAGAAGQSIFPLYLKDSTHPKYTVSQINLYPTGVSAVQVVAELAYAWASDSVLNGSRWPILVVSNLVNIVIYTSLAVWDISEGWRWACYMLANQGIIASPMSIVWGTEICAHDNEERAIIVGAMNDFGYVMGAWLPLIIWQQVDAPRYHKGFITGACGSVVAIFLTIGIKFLAQRDIARRNAAAASAAISATESSPDEHDPARPHVAIDEKAL